VKKVFFASLALVAIASFIQCSVSKTSLDEAEKRIKVLQDKGVPDSSLSRAFVMLYQARDAKQRENRGLARHSSDSLDILIAKAEEQYKNDTQRLQPLIAQMKQKFAAARAELSGLPAAKLDSLVGIIDSLAAKSWYLAAEAKCNLLDTLLPRLKFDMTRTIEVKQRVVGTWAFTDKTTNSADKSVNAVEEKIFTFGKDGKASLIERKKGKSGPFLKEDWEFLSWGNWDVMGDTIHLYINRFKAAKQMFEERHQKDGKDWWEKKPGVTYDSTITDGSQNRFVTFQDLTDDFKKR
jgi:hypothetical protein